MLHLEGDDAWVQRGVLLGSLERAIWTLVVHDQDLQILPGLLHEAPQCDTRSGLTLVRWHDHRHARGGLGRTANPLAPRMLSMHSGRLEIDEFERCQSVLQEDAIDARRRSASSAGDDWPS